MKKRTYDRNNVIRETEKLPAGGYVLKILDAKERNYDWGDRLEIAFDIAEGEYTGFYNKNFQNQTGEDKKWKGVFRLNIPKDDGSEQDQWTQKKFNTNIAAIEDSNAGYFFDWDEAKLKGKLVGAVFNNKEYEFNGNHGFFTNCYGFTSVSNIREGKFKIPKDTLLPNSKAAAIQTDSEGFMSIADGVEEEFPF